MIIKLYCFLLFHIRRKSSSIKHTPDAHSPLYMPLHMKLFILMYINYHRKSKAYLIPFSTFRVQAHRCLWRIF